MPPARDELQSELRTSPEAIAYAQVTALQELRGAVERLERSTWTLVVREALVRGCILLGDQLAAPVWPGRVELRVGTVITLASVAVLLFGGDRAWTLVEWAWSARHARIEWQEGGPPPGEVPLVP